MGRTAKNRDLPHPPPVERVELAARPSWARVAAVLLLLVVGAAALSYAFFLFVSGDAGWQRISANVPGAAQYTLMYDVGADGASPANEKRALTALYTQSLNEAYEAFHTDMAFEGVNNLYTLNANPNTAFTVPAVLYRAFALLAQYGDRTPYLAPAYEIYDDLFTCTQDTQAAYYDPARTPETAAWYGAVAAFARDEASVHMELLGDDRLCLRVSAEYLRYAQENEITTFVDLAWMTNAFTVDWVAQSLLDGGFTRGSFASADGFTRNLDSSDTRCTYPFYDRDGDAVREAAAMQYSGAYSFVLLRDFALGSADAHAYLFADGTRLACYLDPADGLPRAATSAVVGYSGACGCAETLLLLRPFYVADAWQPAALAAPARHGVYAVWRDGGQLCCSDPGASPADGALLLN